MECFSGEEVDGRLEEDGTRFLSQEARPSLPHAAEVKAGMQGSGDSLELCRRYEVFKGGVPVTDRSMKCAALPGLQKASPAPRPQSPRGSRVTVDQALHTRLVSTD